MSLKLICTDQKETQNDHEETQNNFKEIQNSYKETQWDSNDYDKGVKQLQRDTNNNEDMQSN